MFSALLNTDLEDHFGNKSNPHKVTKTQIGLSNVDNTADANKSVMFAQSAGIAKPNAPIVLINNCKAMTWATVTIAAYNTITVYIKNGSDQIVATACVEKLVMKALSSSAKPVILYMGSTQVGQFFVSDTQVGVFPFTGHTGYASGM